MKWWENHLEEKRAITIVVAASSGEKCVFALLASYGCQPSKVLWWR